MDGESRIGEAVAQTLRRHHISKARVSVALVDDAHITELNKRHLQRGEPTDVLAFDLRDDENADETGAGYVEGDVVISVETASREAKRRNHEAIAELALYAVHGTLHLLGYDDQSEAEAAKMHAMEQCVLSGLGWKDVYQADET